MAGKRGQKEKRSAQMTVRIRPSVFRAIQQECRKFGISQGTWVEAKLDGRKLIPLATAAGK